LRDAGIDPGRSAHKRGRNHASMRANTFRDGRNIA
jgi:hypothetical protein